MAGKICLYAVYLIITSLAFTAEIKYLYGMFKIKHAERNIDEMKEIRAKFKINCVCFLSILIFGYIIIFCSDPAHI